MSRLRRLCLVGLRQVQQRALQYLVASFERTGA